MTAGKTETIGHLELGWQRDHQAELPHRLVGLQTADGAIVPAEACQIVDGPRVVGRVTSSRYSPTLGRSVALAMLAPELARPGTTVQVRLTDGRVVDAVVQERTVHLDPDGERMRV